jgi:hypothetical protein
MNDLFDGQAESLTCGYCGFHAECPITSTYDSVLDDFDVLGADDGYVFCPECNSEIDATTGEPK